MSFDWDYFIAHAGADIESAEELYGYLTGPAKVFLDNKCLLLGDDWDRKLAEAQRTSLVTLVLVSNGTERAYYEREEIAAAIDLARRDESRHRVIPIYLDAVTEVPYGLRLKHCLRLGAELSLADAATQLLGELAKVRALVGTAYAPSPEPLPLPASKVTLSIAVDQSPAHADMVGDDAHTLAYQYARGDGTMIVVSPQLEYLDTIEAGGPIDPTRFTWVPFSWDFPKLDFKVVNNGKDTVLLTDVVFEVSESRLDPTPVLVVKPDAFQSNALHFRLLNEGWGPPVGLRAYFHLSSGNSAQPRYDEPYPHEMVIGDFDETANVDISPALVEAGANLAGLAGLGRLSRGTRDEFTFVNEQGVERTFDREQLTTTRRQFFGPFAAGSALVSGEFRYTAHTLDGTDQERRLKFWTVVWLYNENRMGVPRPPSYEYTTKFRVDGANYQRQVSISQEIKAGDTDRFLVKIGFDKSSRHRFRARLLFNGTREVLSPRVELRGFAPRSGIAYLRDKKPSGE